MPGGIACRTVRHTHMISHAPPESHEKRREGWPASFTGSFWGALSSLGERSWTWLARQAAVPKSTLFTQKARPKFSVEMLVAIAHALDRPVTYFLPQEDEMTGVPSTDALAEIRRILRKLE